MKWFNWLRRKSASVLLEDGATLAEFRLNEDSLVVLRCDDFLSVEQSVQLKKQWEYALSDSSIKTLILSGGMDLSILHRGATKKRTMSRADENIGGWLAAALDDPAVCEAMKDDIRTWMDQFSASCNCPGAAGAPPIVHQPSCSARS